MKDKNLYEILGVKKDAMPGEIRIAYKKLASKYHPDRNDDPKANAIMQSITNAYDILSDPKKRKRYDETGSTDNMPTPLEIAKGMIFQLFKHHFKQRDFEKQNYFKIVKEDIETALEACEDDIASNKKAIKNLKYIMEKSNTDGLFDDDFELLLASLEQEQKAIEIGREVIKTALEILTCKCSYDDDPNKHESPRGFIQFMESEMKKGQMKYIVLQVLLGNDEIEVPIIFPDIMVHADVSEYAQHLFRRKHNLYNVNPVSAGFINTLNIGSKDFCYGESETLKLKSRGERDSKLISLYDYHSGIVEELDCIDEKTVEALLKR